MQTAAKACPQLNIRVYSEFGCVQCTGHKRAGASRPVVETCRCTKFQAPLAPCIALKDENAVGDWPLSWVLSYAMHIWHSVAEKVAGKLGRTGLWAELD